MKLAIGMENNGLQVNHLTIIKQMHLVHNGITIYSIYLNNTN